MSIKQTSTTIKRLSVLSLAAIMLVVAVAPAGQVDAARRTDAERAERRVERIEQRELFNWDQFDQVNRRKAARIQTKIDRQNRIQDRAMIGTSDTIASQLTERSQFSTLVAAVDAAGLVPVLNGAGEFTVFAPTDQAFEALLHDLGINAADLLASPELASILTYHVLGSEVDAKTAISLNKQSVATVNGATIDIKVRHGQLFINDSRVVVNNIRASNGIIHVIDTVLLS